MKSQETLSKIMQILNLSEEVKVEAAQATLENGTILEAEAFEPGNEVFIVTEDERVAVPVGEYVMEDGRVLVVAEEGIIGEIREGGEEEAPAEEAPAEEVEAAEEEEVPAEEEEDPNYVTREELAEVVNEIKKMVEEMMSEREEKMASERAEKLSKSKPARKPMKHNPEAKNQPQISLGGQKKQGSTLDRVMSKIAG